MPKPLNQIQPGQAVAICTREQAGQLAGYDHHRVLISGRAGLLLTREWLPLEEHVGPFLLTVVFYQVENHPSAPDHVQEVVNRLHFQIRGQAR
jgi:hypothetical protein